MKTYERFMKMPIDKNFVRTVFVKRDVESDVSEHPLLPVNSIPELLRSGIVVVDKPRGPTTHQVADYVKKILHIKKAGHSGTLDPAVTGVVVVALGDSTKIAQFLLSAGKEYVGILHLHKDVAESDVRSVFEEFTGMIEQMPPIKSAVKRQRRMRQVYYLDLLEIDGRDVLFKVGCQAGTYIRKLAHDIGVRLGCGAHMAELRRTKAGPFNESEAITLQQLTDAYHFWKESGDKSLSNLILPVESAVVHMPKVWIMGSAITTICHGATLKVPGIARFESGISEGDYVALLSSENRLVAIAIAKMSSEELKTADSGLFAVLARVFMNSDGKN